MKRRRTAQKKKLVDDARLLRWWRAFHREGKAVALSGPHARTLAELFRAFANIECVQPTQLVGFVGAIDWNGIDHQTRLVLLHELNTAITKFHEKRGLLPIDDRLPGASPNAFQIIREILAKLPAPLQARPMHPGALSRGKP